VEKFLIPIGFKPHVAIDLEGIFFATPQPLGLGASPANAPGGLGKEPFYPDLFGPGIDPETMVIFLRNILPDDPGKHAVRVGSFLEQVLDCPLAFGIAVTGDLDENALLQSGGVFPPCFIRTSKVAR